MLAASAAILELLDTNTLNVGVPLASRPSVTGSELGVEGLVQAPLLGLVWQSAIEAPVVDSATTLIVEGAPTLILATENAPLPALSSLTMPSPSTVAASAMTSATASVDADSNSVFTPARGTTGAALRQLSLIHI